MEANFQTRIKQFTQDRDWEQFHSPANLAKSIVIESAELLEHFQWADDSFDLQGVSQELADVLIYCYQLADVLGLEVEQIIHSKLDMNEKKYPVDKAKGNSSKYTEFQK